MKGEGNSYDFGARLYDNRLGRWLSVDPYSSTYISYSPYSFVNGNPIICIDPDGKGWDKVIISKVEKGFMDGYNRVTITAEAHVKIKIINYSSSKLNLQDIKSHIESDIEKNFSGTGISYLKSSAFDFVNGTWGARHKMLLLLLS